MGFSHACPRCGQELARVPARLGSVVVQPVVVCPRCGSGWARTPRAARRCISDARRTLHATVYLLCQTIVAAIFAFLVAVLTASLATDAARSPRSPVRLGIERAEMWFEHTPQFTEASLIVLGLRFPLVSAGMILFFVTLAAGWSCVFCIHRSGWRAWLDWLAFTGLALALVLIGQGLTRLTAGLETLGEIASDVEQTGRVAAPLLLVFSAPMLASALVRPSMRRAREHAAARRRRVNLRLARHRRRGSA